MKSNRKMLSIFLIFLTSLFSCVSKKKYSQAVLQRNNLQEEIVSTDAKLKTVLTECDNLKDELSQEKTNKQLALKEKEKELKKREQILENLKEVLNLQQEAVVNLKQQVCEALKCYTPDELSIEVREGKHYVSLADKLLFPSGSDILNTREKEALVKLADVLVSSDMEIMVEGHTDTVPINTVRNKDNWDLSVHLDTSVTRKLIDYGIQPERIIASGRSKYLPLASNKSEEGRKINRRTDVVLEPKLDKLWNLTENNIGEIDNQLVNFNSSELVSDSYISINLNLIFINNSAVVCVPSRKLGSEYTN
jgi:chemotaxis protein MotB